ncbi:MAG TPA: hypothetical protein VME42_11460 [Steroidobacteraceae bacterium]|nr:hypothetical protein [Steroidobacteraceae bacterium]
MAVKRFKRLRDMRDQLTCWEFATWPADVWPHTSSRARHLVRSHLDDLVAAGAVSRVNRQLIIIGVPYLNWIKKHASDVEDFKLPCNTSEQLAKRRRTVNGKEALSSN